MDLLFTFTAVVIVKYLMYVCMYSIYMYEGRNKLYCEPFGNNKNFCMSNIMYVPEIYLV